MPAGRPTSYKPEYCELLIEEMSKGYSFESFAADVNVHKDTLYEWVKVYPEFSDAKKIAFAKCQKFWEGLGIKHVLSTSEKEGREFSKSETLNTGVWVFNMKNRFKWTDRVEVSPLPSAPRDSDVMKLSDEDLDRMLED